MVNGSVKMIAANHDNPGVPCDAVIPGVNRDPSDKGMGQSGDTFGVHEAAERAASGPPEDIANLAAYLASDEIAFMTGGLCKCDGGMTAPLPFGQFQLDYLIPQHKSVTDLVTS